jgi:hypothetical protein
MDKLLNTLNNFNNFLDEINNKLNEVEDKKVNKNESFKTPNKDCKINSLNKLIRFISKKINFNKEDFIYLLHNPNFKDSTEYIFNNIKMQKIENITDEKFINYPIKYILKYTKEFKIDISPKLLEHIFINGEIEYEDIINNSNINWDYYFLSQNLNIDYRTICKLKDKEWNWGIFEYHKDWLQICKFLYMNSTTKILKDIDLHIMYIADQCIENNYIPQNINFLLLSMFIEEKKEITNDDWKIINYSCNIYPCHILYTLDDNKYKWDYDILSTNNNIEIHLIIKTKIKPWNWNYISCNKNIKLKDIIDNPDLPWDINGISKNPNITIEYVNNNLHLQWNWDNLSYNPAITQKDILDNPDIPWNKNWVLANPNITPEFIYINLHIFNIESLRESLFSNDYNYKKKTKYINKIKDNFMHKKIKKIILYLNKNLHKYLVNMVLDYTYIF